MGTHAESTVRAYQGAFDRWCNWADQYGFDSLPTTPTSLCLYLMQLISTGVSFPSIVKSVAAVSWAHDKACLPSPSSDQLVQQVVNAAKRSLARTPQRKEPFSKHHIVQMLELLAEKQSITDLRTAVMIAIGFSGMLRWSDMHILQWKDIQIIGDYLELQLSKRKNDQFRNGTTVRIARQCSSHICPVNLVHEYGQRIRHKQHDFVLSNIRRTKGGKFKAVGRLTYSNARTLLKQAMNAVGLEASAFGLHSLRSGGATAAAAGGISERLIKKHGGWKSEAVQAYIKDSLNDCLKASQATDWCH